MEKVYYNGVEIHDAGRIKAHSRSVRSILQTEDSIITASDDSTIKVWNPIDGTCKMELKGHTDRVRCLTLWRGYLVSGGVDKCIKFWNLSTGECVHTIEGLEGNVLTLNVYRNMLLSGGTDNIIQIWNKKFLSAGKITGHHDWVNDILIWDEDRLITCSEDKTIKVWDMKKNCCIGTLQGHSSYVKKLFRYKNILVSCSFDCTLILWDVDSLAQVGYLKGHTDFVYACCAYGDQLVSADATGAVILWNKELTDKELVINVHTMDIFCMGLYKDRLVTGSRDKSIVIWPPYTQLYAIIQELTTPRKSEESTIMLQKDYIASLEQSLNLLKQEYNILNNNYKETLSKQVSLQDQLNSAQSELLQLNSKLTEKQKSATSTIKSKTAIYDLLLSSLPPMGPSLPRDDFYQVRACDLDYLPCLDLQFTTEYVFHKKDEYEWCNSLYPWKQLSHPHLTAFYGLYAKENEPVHFFLESVPFTLQEVLNPPHDSSSNSESMEEDSNSESEEQSTMNMGFEKDMDDLSSERSGQSLSLPFFARFRLSIQLVETLLYMKSKNLSHGYVSPSTIWVASDGSLKLTLPSMNLFYLKYLHPTLISTYLPPELSDYLVTKKNSISFYTLATMFKEQTDVYNVGLILYYIFTGKEFESVDQLQSVSFRVPELKQLILDCLSLHPSQRPSLLTIYNRLKALQEQSVGSAPLHLSICLQSTTKQLLFFTH